MKLMSLPLSMLALACLLVVSCAHKPESTSQLTHLEGELLDREGNPVGGAWLLLSKYDRLFAWPSHEKLAEAKTDSLGRFSLDYTPGEYTLEITPFSSKGLPSMMIRPFRLSSSLPHATLRLGGSYLTGRVVIPEGKEPRLVSVTAYGESSVVAAHYLGHPPYRLLLPTGSYHLVVHDYTYGFPQLDTTFTVLDHDDSLNVILSGRVIGLHLNTKEDRPLSGAGVRLLTSAGDGYKAAGTDSLGNAGILVRPGRYTFEINPLWGDTRRFQIPWTFAAAIERDTLIAYKLEPVRWSGVVRSVKTKDPVPMAEVQFRESGTSGIGRARPDSAGRIEALMRPGIKYEATSWCLTCYLNRFSLKLDADTTFDLYLEPGVRPPPKPAAPARRDNSK